MEQDRGLQNIVGGRGRGVPGELRLGGTEQAVAESDGGAGRLFVSPRTARARPAA